MIKTKSKNRIIKTLMSVMMVAIILAAVVSVLFTAKSDSVFAEEQPAQTYDIRSAEDLIAYSQAYATGYRNPKDVLNISINSGSVVSDDGFISIGTIGRPFAGTLNIPYSGIDVFHLFNCPLFDYVTTDLQITGAGTVKIMREIWGDDEDPVTGTLTSGALFANHVVKGTNAANWSISLLALTGEGSEASNFESLFGDIAANATVTVNFSNTSTMNVSASGNAGLICGTLNAGATLNVTTSGEGGSITVTSSGGHAGSLVGEMKTGSTLTLNSANNTRVNVVTATNGYAGGLVGCAEDITVAFGTGIKDYAPTGAVTGATGAGGLFGYYKTTAASTTFDLEDTYSINGVTVSSTSAAGGVFGALVVASESTSTFTFDGNGDSTGVSAEDFSVTLSGGTNRGGIAGTFQTASLADALTIQNFKPTVTSSGSAGGGLIGKVDGDNAAYILIDAETGSKPIEISVTSTAGGIIGDLGAKGSFVDVKGNITVSGTTSSGLISKMDAGVLRIKGTTDLSACNSPTATFVGTHGRALIYALGDGNGTNGNWTLTRRTGNGQDDIGSWGEVLRCDGTILSEGDLFTVDMTGHTVTVAAAVTTIDNVTDFAKTALNIQLNTGADIGALRFADKTNKSATLLGATLTLGADISLAGTGLTGLMRDDGNSAAGNDTASAFSGTFDGGNNKITLATGEVYGSNATGTKRGNIFKHAYNGLFSKIKGGTVKDLKINGNIYLRQKADMNVGGVAAYAENCTIDNVTVDVTVTNKIFSDLIGYIGGAIGKIGAGAAATIKGSFTLAYKDTPDNGVGGENDSLVGGVIGCVAASASDQSVTIDDATSVSLTYTREEYESGKKNSSRQSTFGGVIALIENCVYKKARRTITVADSGTVTVNVSASGYAKNGKFGGIFGFRAYAADVILNNLTIASATVTAAGNNLDFGGLVQIATGHWKVDSITLTASKANFNLPGGTFGFITNKAYVNETVTIDKVNVTYESALYVDVTNAGYNIGALTFTGTPSFSVFDELVADSRSYNGDTPNNITNNGNSIVSITTSQVGGVNKIDTGGSSYNTYLNKTTYGRTVANKQINANTRYYYNLADARSKVTTSNKHELLIFTVDTYAHDSLSAWFEGSNGVIGDLTGDLDMTGLSYYPVDLTEVVVFDSSAIALTIKLDNITMEAAVKYAYNYNDGSAHSSDTRTTRTTGNQHYLMHTALFRNVAGTNITISGSNGLTISGNVPKLTDSFCGFIVAGTLGGSDKSTTKFNAEKIALDGVYISNGDSNFTTNAYAPLLINKVGKSTELTINGAAQSTSAYSGYSSKYAASSLIGDVGDASARAIYLTFIGLKLDGRISNTADGDFYGSSRSIFSRATILNSFRYFGESSGTYNFTYAEDWTDGHKVTYGKEITATVEYRDDGSPSNSKQINYYGDSTLYVNPHESAAGSYNNSATAGTTNSFDAFRPYVFTAYNSSTSNHELKVNINDSVEIEGCGKYYDPYIIEDGDQLEILSEIINGTGGGTTKLYFPDDVTSFNYTSISGSTTKKTQYTNGDPFSKVTGTGSGGNTVTKVNARKYLAGAYYVISKDIVLSSDYQALGTVAGSSGEYAFRGVIMARSSVTITNNSNRPLIKNANGAVIKNINIAVTSTTVTLQAPLGSDEYLYSAGIPSYGAVIEQVMGGDNFIDNVNVTFSNVTFDITTDSANNYPRLTPIGGYVGTLFNGGLIFRNMSSAYTGLGTNQTFQISDTSGGGDPVVTAIAMSTKSVYDGYLYVNPIIGRVVMGYAFHEVNTTGNDDTAVTSAYVDNGDKNYTIADLDPTDGDKITVTGSDDQYTINIPNGKSVFILGAAVNSGACSATKGGTNADSNEYANLKVSSTEYYRQAYRANTTVRGGASYTGVGTASDPDYTNACFDKYTSNCAKLPYILRAYVDNGEGHADSSKYMRSLTLNNNNIILITGDCDVPAGFRGIGNIYYNTVISGQRYSYSQLSISKMGSNVVSSVQKNWTITLHMRYLEYNHLYVSSYIGIGATKYDDNYYLMTSGFGFFNKLEMYGASDKNSIQFLQFAGSVFYDVYKVKDSGGPANYNYATFYTSTGSKYDRPDSGNFTSNSKSGSITDNEDRTYRKSILSVGALAGLVTSKIYIKNVTFGEDDLTVEGAKNAGGLIGQFVVKHKDSSYIKYESGYTNAGSVSVTAGFCAGGLVGRMYRASLEIIGTSGTGTDVIVKDIKSKNSDPDEKLEYYFANLNTGVGGIIGNCWASDGEKQTQPKKLKDDPTTFADLNVLFISDINVVKGDGAANIHVENDSGEKHNYAGGFIGSAHNVYLKLNGCKLENVNVSANIAGGFIGKMSQKYYLEITNCSANGNSNASSVTGRRYAGGAVGWTIGRDFIYFQLLNFEIENYNIVSTATTLSSYGAGAGGIVGYTEGNNVSVSDRTDSKLNFVCEFNNLTVKGCLIKTNYTDPDSSNALQYKVGTGGVIGVIDTINVTDQWEPDEPNTSKRSANNKYKFSGYNILVEDCTLTHTVHTFVESVETLTDDSKAFTALGAAANKRIGDIVGNNAISTTIKFVGVSVENSGAYVGATTNEFCGKHVGYINSTSDNYGLDGTFGTGYVVFANYNAATGNTVYSDIIDTEDDPDVDGYRNVSAPDRYDITISDSKLVATKSETGAFLQTTASTPILINGTYYVSTTSGSPRFDITYSNGEFVVTQNDSSGAFTTVAAQGSSKVQISSTYYRLYNGIADDAVGVTAAAPYVTVNPAYTIQNITLTGDGVAETVLGLPIQNILGNVSAAAEDTSKTAFYDYAANYPYVANASSTLVSKNHFGELPATGVAGTVYKVNKALYTWNGSKYSRNTSKSYQTYDDVDDLPETGVANVFYKVGDTYYTWNSSRYVLDNKTHLTYSAYTNLPATGATNTYYTVESAYYIWDGSKYVFASASDLTNYTVLSNYTDKLVTFKSEALSLGYLGKDFAVLLVDDSNAENTHKMINSYLRLLTNTVHNFGEDKAGEYSVFIYNVTYSGSTFTVSASGASLKRNTTNKQFYMTPAAFDSGKIQFSLIDVRFFDPADTTKVAYHLYVPVFVKKVLTYQFDIAIDTGTTYLKSHYTGDYGEALIENTGTPVTAYFEYSYNRTADEWEDAINQGENVNHGYSRKLSFYRANTYDDIKLFPSGTILVLVDPVSGKQYYSTIGDAVSDNELRLSAFRTVLNSDGTLGGDYYQPKKLCELLDFEVSSLTGSRVFVQCEKAAASVVVGSQGYRLAESPADDALTKYSITVTGVKTEKYYLSFFTQTDSTVFVAELDNESGEYVFETDVARITHRDNDGNGYRLAGEGDESKTKYALTEVSAADLFHYYLITTPTSYNDDNYLSKYEAYGAHTASTSLVHLVMGKIFDHDNFSISSNSFASSTSTPYDSNILAQLMDSENDSLEVNMSVQIGISEDLNNAIRTDLQSLIRATEVYQSFLVYLHRKEGADDAHIAILGDPNVATSTYNIDYVLNGTADTSTSSYAVTRVTQGYVEVVTSNIGGSFSSENKFEVNATVKLNYTAEGVNSQFPGRDRNLASTLENGVTVSGASNIAFSAATTTYSKNSVGGDEGENQKTYYSDVRSSVSYLELDPYGDHLGEFTPLGINALNPRANDDPDTASFDLVAILNVSEVYDSLLKYVDDERRGFNGAVITITLREKNSDYATDLELSKYIEDFRIGDDSSVTSAYKTYIASNPDSTTYTVSISKEALSYIDADDESTATIKGSEIRLPTLHFKIKTGSVFEAGDYNRTYGNFRIVANVYLTDGTDTAYNSTIASNYVIYTNAKIRPEYIS